MPGVLISGTEPHRERERNRTCVCHFQETCQLVKDLSYRNTASKCGSCQSFSWTEIMLLVGLPNMNGAGGGLVTKLCPTLATPWTVAFQAPLFIGVSRQEYCSRLPFSSPGHLPD